MEQAGLTQYLLGREPEAIIRTLAMMAYNPAIGRVLQGGSVVKFADLIADEIPKIYSVLIEKFDDWHSGMCARILADFKTAKGEKLSYGQAQKPLNVFLKVYVDWAKLPSRELAEKLTPALHCPLDSVVMRFIKREFPNAYDERIAPVRRYKLDRITERASEIAGTSSQAVARRILGNEFSLAAIDKETYLQWQALCRSLWPGKPVQLDLIWALERRPSSGEPESVDRLITRNGD
jgi:hypothetical protein